METTTTKIRKHIEELYLGTGQMAYLFFDCENRRMYDIIYFEYDDDFVAEVYITNKVEDTCKQLSDFVEGTGWHYTNGVTICDTQLEQTQTTFTGNCQIFRSGVNKVTIVAQGMKE